VTTLSARNCKEERMIQRNVWFKMKGKLYDRTSRSAFRLTGQNVRGLHYPLYDFDLHATHARTFLPAALASVSFGFVLVRVRVIGHLGTTAVWSLKIKPMWLIMYRRVQMIELRKDVCLYLVWLTWSLASLLAPASRKSFTTSALSLHDAEMRGVFSAWLKVKGWMDITIIIWWSILERSKINHQFHYTSF
jgi:hypothetical protein